MLLIFLSWGWTSFSGLQKGNDYWWNVQDSQKRKQNNSTGWQNRQTRGIRRTEFTFNPCKFALVWPDGEKKAAEPPLSSDSWLFVGADSTEIISEQIWQSVLCAVWLVLNSLQALHQQPPEVFNLCNLK